MVVSVTEVQRKTQEQRTDLSDSLMFEAAIRLILERGMAKTTLREVGEMAGYSRGLAGYRFGSKAGLCEFVARSISNKWLVALKRATKGLVGIEALEASVDAHYRFCLDESDYARVFYMLWFDSIEPKNEIRPFMLSIRNRRRKDVVNWINLAVKQGTIEPKMDPEAAAEMFSVAIVGIAYQWLVNPKDIERVTSLYLNLKRSMRLLLGV